MASPMIVIQVKAHKHTPEAKSTTESDSRSMTIVGETVDEAYHRIQILYERLGAGSTDIMFIKEDE